MNKIRLLLCCILCIAASGCGSLMVHVQAPMSDSVRDPRLEAPTPIFGGVMTDLHAIAIDSWNPKSAEPWYVNVLIVPLAIIDLPFSLVLDLCYLPWDIAYWPEWTKLKNAPSEPIPEYHPVYREPTEVPEKNKKP